VKYTLFFAHNNTVYNMSQNIISIRRKVTYHINLSSFLPRYSLVLAMYSQCMLNICSMYAHYMLTTLSSYSYVNKNAPFRVRVVPVYIFNVHNHEITIKIPQKSKSD